MRRFLLPVSLVSVGAAALATACGHLPFDELPASDDIALGDAAPGTRTDGNIVIFDEGGVVVEAGPPADTGIIVDPPPPPTDSGVPDAAACPNDAKCGVIYVAAKAGQVGALGTADAPVPSIVEALKINLENPGRSIIRIAGGSYSELLHITQHVEIEGGWTCEKKGCTWVPPSDKKNASPTIVTAPDLIGGAALIEMVGPETVLDYVHFIGGSGGSPGGTAIGKTVAVLGAAPRLVNLTIDGPKTQNATASVALAVVGVAGAKPAAQATVVDGCTINGGGGSSADVAYGIAVGAPDTADTSEPQVALVIQNHSNIFGGNAKATVALGIGKTAKASVDQSDVQALPSNANGSSQIPRAWAVSVRGTAAITRSRINPLSLNANSFCATEKVVCGGIETTDGTVVLQNSLVFGVPAPVTTAVSIVATVSAGISSGVIIDGNVLDGSGLKDPATDISSAIRLVNAGAGHLSVGTVRNTILRGGRAANNFAIYEADMAASSVHLQALDHDDIRVSTYAYRAWSNATPNSYPFAKLPESPLGPVQGKNREDDCLLDETTFKLDPTSLCIDKGAKADDTTPLDDYFGTPRPQLDDIDIGLFESLVKKP